MVRVGFLKVLSVLPLPTLPKGLAMKAQDHRGKWTLKLRREDGLIVEQDIVHNSRLICMKVSW